MPLIVKDIMSHPAIFIDPDASVAHASTLMRRRGIRSLIVSVEKDEFGIITTTDIRDKIVGEDEDPRQTSVREIMSSPVLTADPEWSLKECSRKMKEVDVNHLPVADDRGMIIGMVSAVDIFIAVEEQGWGD
mgnify:CR=1 FL=1